MPDKQSVKQPDSALWAVRGVEMEARTAAKMAAKRARQPLGVWLSRTIRDAAAAELTGKPRDHTPANTLEQTVTTLVKLMQEREAREEERRTQDAARLAAIEAAAQARREEAAALRARLDEAEADRQRWEREAEQERHRQQQEAEAARRRSIFARLFGLK